MTVPAPAAARNGPGCDRHKDSLKNADWRHFDRQDGNHLMGLTKRFGPYQSAGFDVDPGLG